jgi:4'-phosphopantetheinyl transferase
VFALSLDQIDVSLTPMEAARPLTIAGDPQASTRWAIRELLPASGYVAALAVERRDWRLACWQRWS